MNSRPKGGSHLVHTDHLNGTDWQFHYDDACFPPGTDSFLLSSLPPLKSGIQVLDLGAGYGLLGLLLLRRCPDLIVTGLELNAHAVELGKRNAEENQLSQHLLFRQGDLREHASIPAGHFDLVVCNPPYFPSGHGASAPDVARRGAREEVSCTLEDVCMAAARALRWSGSFCLVHKPDRLTDLLCAMRTAKLEPKRLCLSRHRTDGPISLVLLQCRKGGKPGLILEEESFFTPQGIPTEYYRKLYHL